MKVLEVDRSGFRLHENSFTIVWYNTFENLSNPHSCCWFTCSIYLSVCICVRIASCCVRFHYVFDIYFFQTHDLCSCSFCLLFSCEMVVSTYLTISRNNSVKYSFYCGKDISLCVFVSYNYFTYKIIVESTVTFNRRTASDVVFFVK